MKTDKNCKLGNMGSDKIWKKIFILIKFVIFHNFQLTGSLPCRRRTFVVSLIFDVYTRNWKLTFYNFVCLILDNTHHLSKITDKISVKI